MTTDSYTLLAWLWLGMLLAASAWLYWGGRICVRRWPRSLLMLLLVSWGGTLAVVLLRSHPGVEFRLLAWPGYAYVRGGAYLPGAALFVGVVRAFMQPRSEKALRALLIFLAVVVVYDFRWGLGVVDYRDLNGPRDRFGIVRNSHPETTGAAAAATLAYYYGVPVSEGWMARATLTRSSKGVDSLGLCHGLITALRGSECRVTLEEFDYDELLEQPFPMLLLMREGRAQCQAMVVLSADANGALLADPRHGLSYMNRQTVMALWSGEAIVIHAPPYLKPTPRRPLWTNRTTCPWRCKAESA